MRNRPFPTEEDLASIDEEALKAKDQADKNKDDDEEEEFIGEIELSKKIIRKHGVVLEDPTGLDESTTF